MRVPIYLFVFFGVLAIFAGPTAYASSVKINDIKTGQGQVAQSGQIVRVHYTGWLMDGQKFDSSRARHKPFEFTLGAGRVIPGWEQGIPGMKEGGVRELVIPSQLAYGKKGAGNIIPANATLRFEVELLEVVSLPYVNVTVSEAQNVLAQGAKIVDVRTPQEWQQSGVVEGSILLPFRMPDGRVNGNFLNDFAKLANKDEKIILICRSGNRSRAAAQMLAVQGGYKNVYNVTRGIRAWLADGKPVAKADLSTLGTNCLLCQ